MLEFLVILIVMLLATMIFSFYIAYDCVSFSEEKSFCFGLFGVLCLIINLALCGWIITKAHFTLETATVSTVSNIDMVVIDGELINLNKEFRRDFEEGDTIVYRPAQWQNGIWYERKFIDPNLDVKAEKPLDK